MNATYKGKKQFIHLLSDSIFITKHSDFSRLKEEAKSIERRKTIREIALVSSSIPILFVSFAIFFAIQDPLTSTLSLVALAALLYYLFKFVVRVEQTWNIMKKDIVSVRVDTFDRMFITYKQDEKLKETMFMLPPDSEATAHILNALWWEGYDIHLVDVQKDNWLKKVSAANRILFKFYLISLVIYQLYTGEANMMTAFNISVVLFTFELILQSYPLKSELYRGRGN